MRSYEQVAPDLYIDDFRIAEVTTVTRPAINIAGLFDIPVGADMLMCGYGHWTQDERASGAAIVIPGDLLQDLPSPDPCLHTKQIANDHYFFYQDASERRIHDIVTRRGQQLQKTSPPSQEAMEDTAAQVTIDEAAELIVNTHLKDPRSVLFYTGAGMSSAPSGGVWTYQRFAEHVGFSQVEHWSTPGINKQFMDNFLMSERHRQRCLAMLDKFVEQLRSSTPTDAHLALTGIVRALNMKPLVATTNVDSLHEEAGIEVPIVGRDAQNRPTARFENQRWFDAILERRAPHIKLVVAVGRSNDNRRLLEYVSKASPDVQILILNLKHSAQIQEHARPGDFILQGNCQDTLVALELAIRERMSNPV
jgi:hypothetical protein